jgi:hypothetical protein
MHDWNTSTLLACRRAERTNKYANQDYSPKFQDSSLQIDGMRHKQPQAHDLILAPHFRASFAGRAPINR